MNNQDFARIFGRFKIFYSKYSVLIRIFRLIFALVLVVVGMWAFFISIPNVLQPNSGWVEMLSYLWPAYACLLFAGLLVRGVSFPSNVAELLTPTFDNAPEAQDITIGDTADGAHVTVSTNPVASVTIPVEFQSGLTDIEAKKAFARFQLRKVKIAIQYSSVSRGTKRQSNSLLKEAEDAINQARTISEVAYAEEHIKIASSLGNAVNKDSRVVLIYTAFIIMSMVILGIVTWGKWNEIAFSNLVFGVPLGIIIWSAIGGFASVPYRYVFQQQEFQEPTVKWLFIRPIMGVILGTVAYFAFSLSLFALDNGNLDVTKLTENRSVIFLMLAFFAGFSDKFAVFILQSVIGRIAPAWTSKQSPDGEKESDTSESIEE